MDIQKGSVVTIQDLRQMNTNYDFRELEPYIGRSGIAQFVDEDMGEVSVSFCDLCSKRYHDAEPSNWFPLNQVEVVSWGTLGIDEPINFDVDTTATNVTQG